MGGVSGVKRPERDETREEREERRIEEGASFEDWYGFLLKGALLDRHFKMDGKEGEDDKPEG